MRTSVRLLGFLGPYRWRVVLAVALGVVTVVSNVGLLATAAYVISAAAVVPYLSMLVIPVYLVRLFSVSRAASRYAERLASHDLTFKLLGTLRTRFYARLAPLAPARLLRYRSGDLLSRIVKDVEELENLYLRIVSPLVVALVVAAISFLVFYAFGAAMAFAAVGFLLAAGAGVPLLARRLSRGLGRRQLELRAGLGARVVDDVQGVQDLLVFRGEERERREIRGLAGKLDRVQDRMALLTGLRGALSDLVMGLALVAIVALAAPLVAAGEVRGVYLAFLALVMLGGFEVVVPLGTAFQFLGRSVHAGERLFEVIDAEPEVLDPKEPLPLPDDCSLEFDGVSFGYEEDAPLAVRDVTFALRPGSRVAIVGPSASGKSTLVSLALRFWDPDAGEVRFGGHDVRLYAQEDLRARIGVVSQNTHVFNDALRANLSLADPDASDAALKDALARARLEELVERLPEGLDTHVGEQGLALSGGERQRLAVARALLEDAPLLVLDEASANLDTITERELMEEVRDLMEGRTMLVVTHRLVAMETMDEILVLEGGRIVERGTHEELARAGGLYRRMLDLQRGMLLAEPEVELVKADQDADQRGSGTMVGEDCIVGSSETDGR
jgi:ATP-binding cassette, subfamily C, bacterial CydC